MSDISIRVQGKAGRITLQRPDALNALTYDMVLQIETALDTWADDADVKLVVIDAEGERAFCAGGDIQAMYDSASKGDFEYGRRFWRDEYRLNAKIFNFPKPYVAFMQGFTMGGGVGVSCHGSHRIVCESSQIAMPECGIGLIPDVGGSLLLARAPGRLGEYLGTTGTRMKAADAIYAEFADYFVSISTWPKLIEDLEATGDWEAIDRAAETPPNTTLSALQTNIDAYFGGETAADILRGLPDTEWAQGAAKRMRHACPLSVAATVEIIHRVRGPETIEYALQQEYRFAGRSASEGDFIEGIRAAVIDRDQNPNWHHTRIEDVSIMDVAKMLMPADDGDFIVESQGTRS